jgi:hypothetical protein
MASRFILNFNTLISSQILEKSIVAPRAVHACKNQPEDEATPSIRIEECEVIAGPRDLDQAAPY